MATEESKIMDLPKQFKKWSMIALAILVISVLVRVSFIRFPFFVVFTWVSFFFVIPYIWEIYGKDAVALKFWGSVSKFFLKFLGSLFIFLLIRGYVAYLVDFGMMTAQTIGEKTGMAGWLERNQPEVLFEATFLLLIGYTVLVFVYKHGESGKKKWPRNVVVGILFTCMMAQIFMFASGDVGKVAMAAIKPVKAENSIPKIDSSGVVGGGAKIAFAFLFGESRPSMSKMTGSNKTQTPQVIFSQTYTDADLNNDGTVVVVDYTQMHIERGDIIMVYVTSPEGDNDVQVADGSNWLTVPDGGVYKVVCTNSIVRGGKTVKVNKGKGVRVSSELIRNS